MTASVSPVAGLRELAERATPGEWVADTSRIADATLMLADKPWPEHDALGQVYSHADAAFIAAASPDVVVGLCDLYDKMARLHTPEKRYQPHPDAEWSVRDPKDCEDWDGNVVENPHVFEVCAECGRMEMLTDQHDLGDECPHAYQDSVWPCPTAAALSAARLAIEGGQ